MSDHDLLETILRKKRFHQEEIKKLDVILTIYSKKSTDTPIRNNNKTMKIQIINLVHENKRLLTTEQIAQELIGEISHAERRTQVIRFSGILGIIKRAGQIKSYTVKGRKAFYWGVPEMFDGDNPKKEYLKYI